MAIFRSGTILVVMETQLVGLEPTLFLGAEVCPVVFSLLAHGEVPPGARRGPGLWRGQFLQPGVAHRRPPRVPARPRCLDPGGETPPTDPLQSKGTHFLSGETRRHSGWSFLGD